MSNDDKLLLAQGGATIKCQIIVKATSELPEITLTERDAIKDWEYTDERYVPKQGFIGQFVARTLSGNLQNINDDFNIDGREIELKIGITSNDNTNWYSLGNFIITDPTDNDVTDNTKFEAMDYTKLFNKRFDGDFKNNNFPESYNEIINNKRGVTALWLVEYCCEQVGVEFGQTTFTNDDFIISQNPFQAGETCRDVLKEISKLAYSWVRIGWDNKCYIDFNQVEGDVVPEENIITNNHYYTLETRKELYGPINNVVIGMSGIDGESHSQKDVDSISEHGEHTIYIYNNPLTNTFELRALAQQKAYKLFGLKYAQINVETIGHPWLQASEKINVLNMENVSNITYPFNRTIKFSGHIRTTIDSITDSEIEETLAYESDIIKNIRNASINVDKQNARIDILVKDNESSKEGFNKRINTLELTSTSTISRIETIEGDIAETNKNLGLLDEDIQGVSADLTDFKDNEYVQGINNLQKQIDGAIQFWNGPDIPTLNNYPASDWKTEVDKTNHQADIYTVIEDVDGEMKQGKSYRFDKVNGTWMWIELTDNELSAVQAIAQEALDKANANIKDVGNLKTNVSELKQTDEQLTASVESINKQIVPTTGMTGSDIYVKDALNNPLIYFEIEGKSVQDGTPTPGVPIEIESVGYENLLPSLNTTRTINGVTFTKNNDGSITINGTATAGFDYIVTNANNTTTRDQNIEIGDYVLSGINSGSSSTYFIQLVVNDGTDTSYITLYDGEKKFKINSSSLYYVLIAIRNGATVNTTVYPMIEKGSIAHSYIPYGKSGIEIISRSGNLLDFQSALSYWLISDYTHDNGLYTLPTTIGNGYSQPFPLKLKDNTTYTLSNKSVAQTSTGLRIQLMENDTAIHAVYLGASGNSYTFTTKPGNTYAIRINYTTGGFPIYVKDLMINEGSKIEYEPYKENTSLFVLNQPLRSLPNGVKDIAYIKNNKLYVDRYIGSKVLNGSEVWITNDGDNLFYSQSATGAKDGGYCISNHYKGTNVSWIDLKDKEICTAMGGGVNDWVLLKDTRFNNLNDFKTWLSTHNTQVDYELTEPYTEELGEIDIPSTFEGVNNITTTDILEPVINLTYATNTLIANYVEKHIAELKISDEEIRTKVSSVDEFATSLGSSIDSELQEIGKNFNNYVPTSDFVTLEKSVETLQTDTYTKTEINTKLTDGSVTKVMTTSGTFDEDGMHYEKTNAPTSSTINEKGVEVDSTTSGEELLFAGYDEELKQTIVRTENLTVRKYFIVGDNSRIENYGNGGGIFII